MSALSSSERWASVPQGFLPASTCSVASFLTFPVPPPAPKVCPSDLLEAEPLTFFSPERATCLDLEKIITIALPHNDLISLLETTLMDTRVKNVRSVKVLHTGGQRQEILPLWIIKYWKQVATFMPMRSRFTAAEIFLLGDPCSRLRTQDDMPNGITVMREALDLLYHVGWQDTMQGFDEKDFVVKSTEFASREWLASSHINYMLELLRIKLARAGRVGVVMASVHFFAKVVQAYKARDAGLYKTSNDFRLPRKYGDIIAMSNDDLFSIGNVDETHWLPFVISPTTSSVRSANSLSRSKPFHPELRAALD